METRPRDGALTAIFDDERPHRVALLDSRRFGEPVPVDAVLRHPCSAARPPVPRVVGRLRHEDLARVVELARWRKPVTP